MRNKRLTKGKPIQLTARLPENRNGTKSYIKCAQYGGCSATAARAKPRHWARARQLFDLPRRQAVHAKAGRFVAACYANLMQSFGDHCDSYF